jgi:acyl-coenzyme A synthetase/AMP-(fatty) acid ligase
MGDCGYLDAAGRLWFCGRKAERVQTANGPVFTEQVEPLMNRHPAVRRSALVGLGPAGHQQPWLVVELADGVRADDAVRADLLALARRHPRTAVLAGVAFHPRFPVDVRHNAKIHRLTLARWLAARSPAAAPAS